MIRYEICLTDTDACNLLLDAISMNPFPIIRREQAWDRTSLTLTLTDANGKTINGYTYEGAVTGNMMGVKQDFMSKNNLDHFFLTAKLWQSDKLVDQATLEYDCNKIDPKLCNSKNSL